MMLIFGLKCISVTGMNRNQQKRGKFYNCFSHSLCTNIACNYILQLKHALHDATILDDIANR